VGKEVQGRRSRVFFLSKPQRKPRVLTDEVILKIHSYLELGEDIDFICSQLSLKKATLKKAIRQGRVMVPDKPVHQTTLPTKSQRNALDNNQAIGKACSNVMQRVLAMKTGAGCPIQFYHQTDLQNAGVLLALPALLSQGLLRYEHDFKLENVYYSSRSIFISLAILSLLRIKNLSKVDSLSPGELGRTIGLDRIPEVKTLRIRIAQFCEKANIEKWRMQLSKDWMENSPELSAVLYIDGHVKLYYGKDTSPPKRFVSRMRLCLSGTTDYWVNDALGQPFFVVNKTISSGLIQTIKKDLLEAFNSDVPNQPTQEELQENKHLGRYMLVFDREGYSPDFIHDMWVERISIATYKKNVTDKWDNAEFTEYTGTLPFGTQKNIALAERGVLLQNKGSKKKIWAREIRSLSKSGHQTSIVTTNYTLPIIMIGLYMFARWSQENFFKYMMQEFGIDSLVSYAKEEVDDTTMLVNPEYRRLENLRRKKTSKLNVIKAKFATLTLQQESIDSTNMEKYLSKKEELKKEIEQVEFDIENVKTQRKSVPKQIEYRKLPENKKFDKVVNQRKHFLDTIKLIAYRAETALSNIAKEYMAHKDESRLLLKQIYQTDANLIVDKEKQLLIVEIHTLSHWKDDIVLEKLCQIMNETETKFPDSNLTLFYRTVSS
jgi:hypothetical protein